MGNTLLHKGEDMTREEIVSKIAKDADITKKQASAALSSFLGSVTNALSKKDKVALVGFGTFSVKHRSERSGRNPQTGADLTIPARDVPSFKAGKGLKDAIK